MLPELIQKAKLLEVLFQIDVDLTNQTQKMDCPFCGSALHRADYPRKPRGISASIPDEYLKRLSLCCSNEQCRRRVNTNTGLDPALTYRFGLWYEKLNTS